MIIVLWILISIALLVCVILSLLLFPRITVRSQFSFSNGEADSHIDISWFHHYILHIAVAPLKKDVVVRLGWIKKRLGAERGREEGDEEREVDSEGLKEFVREEPGKDASEEQSESASEKLSEGASQDASEELSESASQDASEELSESASQEQKTSEEDFGDARSEQLRVDSAYHNADSAPHIPLNQQGSSTDVHEADVVSGAEEDKPGDQNEQGSADSSGSTDSTKEHLEPEPEKEKKRSFIWRLKRNKIVFVLRQGYLIKSFLRWLLRIVRSVFHIISFNHFSVAIRANLQNPALTGIAAGYVGILNTIIASGKNKHTIQPLTFAPVFDESCFSISGSFEFRTSVFQILSPLLVALFTLPLFGTLRALITMWWYFRRLKKADTVEIRTQEA